MFDIDLDKPDTGTYRSQLLRTEHCPVAAAPLKIIAAIEGPAMSRFQPEDRYA